MKVTGTWEGYYEYGAGYILPFFAQRVKIIVRIQEHDGSFTGTSDEEESQFSVPYQSIIKGFRDQDLISFVSTYPIKPILSEDETKTEIKEGQHEVEHTGYFDEQNGAMYGTWIIIDNRLNEFEEGKFCEGIWLLKQVKNYVD